MNAENIRQVIKALEHVSTKSGSRPICFSVGDYLMNNDDSCQWKASLHFDQTKGESWKDWAHYSNSGSFPIPVTKKGFECASDQFFADLENRQLWDGEAGKQRRSLLKHMLAFYRRELARLLPPGFEGFKAFVTSKNSQDGIDNNDWTTCAVGEYARFKGILTDDAGFWSPLTALARELTEGKPTLYQKLNFGKFANYGQLKRYLQKNYK